MKVVLARDFDGYADLIRERLPWAEVIVAAGPLADQLSDADVLVCTRLSPEDTRHARRLRLVQSLSTGSEGVDADALPDGCALCNVHGHEAAIAEWAVMAMLALSRRLLVYDRDLRAGLWHRYGVESLPEAADLRGRTVGTVGYGHIGQAVAELARAIGMHAIAVTRAPDDVRAAGLRWLGGLDRLDLLLDEADVAVVCLPGTLETRGLVGAEQLRRLGRDGHVLNVGRGDVVEEQALYEALRDDVVGGAAIDVWYRYPRREGELVQPSGFPFHELDNVLMTPHVSAHAESTRRARRAFVAEQLVRLAEGRPLAHVLRIGGSG